MRGWSLHFHKRSADDSGKCHILESGDGAYVAVFEICADEKTHLDRIEGVGNGYENCTIDVPGFGQCFTYLASASHICDDLRPYAWYREIVLLGCLELELPSEYVSKVEAVDAIPDPDQQRSRVNWDIVEKLRNDNQKSEMAYRCDFKK